MVGETTLTVTGSSEGYAGLLWGQNRGSMLMDSPLAWIWVPHLPAFREAGGWAAQFEMSVRMTFEAVFSEPGTAKDINEMFERVVEELRPHLGAEQIEALTSIGLCQLRHDLLHCRLSKAYGKLGGKNNDPSVLAVAKIDGDSVLDSINRAVSGGAVPVPQTKTADAGILAWVAQAGAAGVFPSATRTFERACLAMHAGLTERGKRILGRE
jgi:hypothetical protein